MSNEQNFDAIIIGAGVIGNAVAFELSKQGLKTLNIDRNHVSGYGSTSASCAIIRVHYSTFDGCALAYESYHFWKDWMAYFCLLYTSPSPRDISGSRMPSSA